MKTTFNDVDEIVNKTDGFFWDGWDLFFFVKDSSGFLKKNGLLRNGEWGVKVNIKTDSEGRWLIPDKFLRA